MRLVLLLVLCAISSVAYAARSIIGVQSYAVGLCSNFNMVSAGILNVVEQTTRQELGTAPAENAGNGAVYFQVRTPTFDTKLYYIDAATFTISTTNQINTADAPDDSNGLGGSQYNPNILRWISAGRFTAGSQGHFRTYNANVIDVDSGPGTAMNAGTGPAATSDVTQMYMQYSTAGGPRVGRWDSTTFTLQESDLIDGGIGLTGLALDGNFLYGAASPTTIKRWTKTNIAGSETNFVPGFATASIRVPSISSDGYMFVPGRSAGLSPNILYRVRLSDMTITGQTNFGNTQFLDQVLIDEFNDKLYVTFSNGNDQQIRRINRSTMVAEQTFVGTSTLNGPTQGQTRIDIPHQAIYIPFNGGGVDTSKVQKVTLCQ